MSQRTVSEQCDSAIQTEVDRDRCADPVGFAVMESGGVGTGEYGMHLQSAMLRTLKDLHIKPDKE